MGEAAALTCRGLTRTFDGSRGVVDLDVDVAPGEVLALLGPNGAGKTTTVRLWNGVLAADAGEARVLGLDPWVDGDALRRRTGVVTEHAGLDDRFTARENLRLAARLRGLDPARSDRRAHELLDRLGMATLADVVVRGFSTGERKRVALARALLHEPDLLFLDEPTSGLDPAAGRGVVELIASLAAEHGRTIVLCTHLLAEAGRLADRMAVLVDGSLRASGAPAEIASRLWTRRRTDIDLGERATDTALDAVRAVRGTVEVTATDIGISLQVDDRDTVAAVVAALVGIGAPVHGVHSHEPTLEDVYFAIEGTAAFR